MSRMHRLISKGISVLLLLGPSLLISACASEPLTDPAASKIVRKASSQKVFLASYDSVWRATQLALKYPIAMNNMDTGILETEWIKAVDGFQSPVVEKDPSSGIRYKLNLNLVKGKLEGRDSVRVTLVKQIERLRDFFSEPESLPSDGLEEKVIFYRIERELIIDDGLKKSALKKNSR